MSPPLGWGLSGDPNSTVLTHQYNADAQQYLAVPYKNPYGSDSIEPKKT